MTDLMAAVDELPAYRLYADDPAAMGHSAAFLAAVSVAGLRDVHIVAPKTVADNTWTGANREICR